MLDFLVPPEKKIKIGSRTKTFLSKMKKIKVVQNCLKCRENWLKTSFGLFSPFQKKVLGGVQHFFVENEKIKFVQNCLKWREIWLKTSFGLFNPTQKNLGGEQNFLVK